MSKPRSFLLIPGAGGAAWYWHLVVAELERRGHDAVAVDLPAEDDSAGWQEYVDVAVASAGDRDDLVVVGSSMGAFTASLLPGVLPVSLLVLVNAMSRRPARPAATGGTTPGRVRPSGPTTSERAGRPVPTSMPSSCSCTTFRSRW